MAQLDFGTRTPTDQARWIRDHDDAVEVLKSPLFANTLQNGVNFPVIGGNLLSLVGDEHAARRRSEIVMFSRRGQLEYEFELVQPTVVRQLEASLAGESSWVPLDLMRLARNSLVRVSARVVGLDGVDTDDATERLLDYSGRLGEAFAIDWSTGDPDEIMADALAAKAGFIRDYFEPSCRRRRDLIARSARGEAVELPGDLLTILLGGGETWDEDQLAREAIFFLVASANTTTHSTPHVYLEIARWFDAHPGRRSLAGELSFVQRAVVEALRLHPTVPALPRVALADIELASGTRFHRGEFFAVDSNSANRSPAVFGPDADEFDPFRELANRSHGYATSFGAGPHVCPGRLVAVGGGTGVVPSDDAPAGVLTRMFHEAFKYDLRLIPGQTPELRTDTKTNRYASFPVQVRRRPAGAGPYIAAEG